jgi:hypothetical protein
MPQFLYPNVCCRHLAADARYRNLTKVMWSTSRRVKDMEDCKKLGAAHYLIKPADYRELKNMIRQMTSILESMGVFFTGPPSTQPDAAE